MYVFVFLLETVFIYRQFEITYFIFSDENFPSVSKDHGLKNKLKLLLVLPCFEFIKQASISCFMGTAILKWFNSGLINIIGACTKPVPKIQLKKLPECMIFLYTYFSSVKFPNFVSPPLRRRCIRSEKYKLIFVYSSTKAMKFLMFNFKHMRSLPSAIHSKISWINFMLVIIRIAEWKIL